MASDTAGGPQLSAILLAHNERQLLPQTLAGLAPALAELSVSAEIIVVDDGSTDGTADAARAAAGPLHLRVVTHATRLGYGRAVRTGLEAALGHRVLYLDGDNQYDPAQLADLWHAMDTHHADLVSGIRQHRQDPTHRVFLGHTYNRLVRAAFRLPHPDMDCGFKLLSRRAVDTLTPRLRCQGNLLGPELFAKAHRAGLTIHQLPVRHRARQSGRPKGADLFAIFAAARELLMYWPELRP